ncbi:DUF402 domain-containing protein [Haloechinothrix alba]|nr:DUF402 domain-containing protein [Haloechinothrix alba]
MDVMFGQPHPPKTETFDLVGMTNTDPKGFVRPVEEYRSRPFGLYMARPTPGRAQFHYLESWLLPAVGLRISVFWYNPGHERDWDLYLDVVTVERGERYWVARDLYLDIDLRTGTRAAVRDTDELLAAHRAGLVELTDATAAMDTALHTVDALARHGYDLDRWLASLDITLTWRGR